MLSCTEVLIFQLSLQLISENHCQLNYLIVITEHSSAFCVGLLCTIESLKSSDAKGNSFKMNLRKCSVKNID